MLTQLVVYTLHLQLGTWISATLPAKHCKVIKTLLLLSLLAAEQSMLRQCRERQVELELRQYEDEEDSLIAAAMESMTMTASSVICPICQK
jgi:hypothetical protein